VKHLLLGDLYPPLCAAVAVLFFVIGYSWPLHTDQAPTKPAKAQHLRPRPPYPGKLPAFTLPAKISPPAWKPEDILDPR
jgi:hypothetical protein